MLVSTSIIFPSANSTKCLGPSKFVRYENLIILRDSYPTMKVCKKWGEVLFIDDSDKCNRLSKRICIKSSHSMLLFATILVSLNNVIYDIKLLGGNDVESIVGIIDDIGEVKAGLEQVLQSKDNVSPNDVGDDRNNDFNDKEPECAYEGLDDFNKDSTTRDLDGDNSDKVNPNKDISDEHPDRDDASKQHSGFSLLERLEETIKVGTALDLNMEGCEITLASLIGDDGELLVWGNSQFDFASISARGMLGEIICVWNNLVFRKSKILCNDNYVLVEGLWIPNDVRLMWIVVYAPQNLSTKIALWSSLVNIIGSWDGNLVMMGDFNEVRKAGGFKFTWTDKWGTKMSKLDRFLVSESFYENFPHVMGVVLEKGIPDHRPILLKDFKKKRRQLAINEILKNGDWIEEPDRVKNEFFEHFSKRFQRFNGIQPTLNVDMPNMLSPTQRDYLEIQFSRDEIKRAVWDCGGDRALGPDEITFKFIKTFWDMIKDDVVHFVNEFFYRMSIHIIGKLLANRLGSVIGSCISSEQSAFIKGRNILDGPLILNEVMAWYRKRKKELMVFKVDFEKAFDSLRWDYLDMIMGKLGIGHKWRFWIFGCLHSAHSSVLVNGSPTSEFDICRGLRQGDPLSPFLFILAMEGLHMLTHKAEAMGIFKVGVPEAIVSNMAYSIGCGAANFPMKYLGVPVGAHLLSVGGQLSLIKSVLGHLPTYYMSIYHMPSTIVKKLETMRNQFFLGGDIDERKISSTLWVRVIKSIHGPHGNINDTSPGRLSYSTWGGDSRLWTLDLWVLLFASIGIWSTPTLSNKVKDYLEGVGGTLMWSIWSFINRLIIFNTPPIKAVLWDFIVSQSYLWISSRNPKSKIGWVDWLRNPIVSITHM
ncbi:putative RNA-directed DNA polymerase, eukaryota, reverse transcriptase zinc-binding domain protein [Tanacetum coccineum]|uniref:RNA-directed DNA polymerase, eukaryota, reverse transcriptase zinc-binding domain protein n=1 Tax=Tanacetum coccineum TaxID=301880 RepID=A0ABQ5DBU4_9ASTR